MGFFSSLLTNDGIVDGAKKGIDAAFLTDEERTQYFLKYIEASMPMNVARRFIAIVVTLVWALGFFLCVSLMLLESSLFKDMADFVTLYVAPTFGGMTAFYFWRRIDKG